MWSCGVVTHVLLTGTLPSAALHAACATDARPSDTREALQAEEAFTAVSHDALDFLCALLRPHGSRLSASAALSHGWIATSPEPTPKGAPLPTLTPSPLPSASPLLLTPRRLRETRLAARNDFRDAFREGPSPGWSHADRRTSHRAHEGDDEGHRHERSPLASGHALRVAEIPQAALPPPAFKHSRAGRSFASSARSLSVASGLDLLADEPFPRKRASDVGIPLVPQTPSTAACTPTSIPCDEPTASAAGVATSPEREPPMKRARSIASCLMDLQFQELA